jgi:NAD(P)-dependent dehydrogenase (short-subunit alcohol dehydrogenase family)
MTDTKAKKILLTGATRGLGLAMAGGFIGAGHTLIGCGRDASQIKQLAADFPEHHFSVVDVSDYQAVCDWSEVVTRECGAPDIIVNNAAIINANAPLWEVPAADFSRLVDINIKGVYHVLQQFVPAMIAGNGGVIVNFSSTWGRSVSADVASYCCSKFAIEGLTRALAEDLPAGLAAVALNPGVIHTDMLDSCFGDAAAGCEKPDRWAGRAVPFILNLGQRDNGQSLTVQ